MDQENGGGLPPDQTGTYPDDPHGPPPAEVLPPPSTALVPPAAAGGGGRIPPPPPPDDEEEDGEEGGMLRMSFMEHLEELRSRILRMLAGLGVAFLLCIIFSDRLWLIVQAPGTEALRQTGNPLAHFIAIDPMEQFSIIWMWTPLVASLFVAAPWILWQVWGFISPGLYKREKRWAAPFVISTAGLFILGGMFAYFIAFRYALAFLFNIGGFAGVVPSISIDRYFDLFVNVMLGIGLVFELPILVFFLTLLHIVSPRFLLKHSRYAILAIVIIAAIVTPTPDVFNLMLFAVPMCMLFFLGIFASYILVLRRENRRFPWAAFMKWLVVAVLMVAAFVVAAITVLHYHLVWYWPFLTK